MTRRDDWNRFLHWTLACWLGALTVFSSLAGKARADALIDSQDRLITGTILSMDKGNLSIDTEGGLHVLPLDKVKSFKIDRKPDAEPTPFPFEEIMTNQQRLAERLDNLMMVISNIEKQLGGVQVAQERQAQRLVERTLDLNAQARMAISNSQISHQGGKTVVTGQVLNQAEVGVFNVQVEVTLYGDTGKIRNEGGKKSKTVKVAPDLLPPGGTGTFTAQFDGPLDVRNFEVQPRGYNPTGYNTRFRDQAARNPNPIPGSQ
ncbi:MAG: hypothetical protein HUU16_09840 [Candidatus Omnitrophica bacterium]|nr:hypothetical protein [Candidatus Omnitrophota bacterium]